MSVASDHGAELDVDVIALGRVIDEGRGSLPFALVHGEALVACATWALSEAAVLPLDARTVDRGRASTPVSRWCCTTRCAR